MVISLVFAFNIALLARVAVAEGIPFNYTTIDPSQCVAPNDYLTCYNAAVANTANCVATTSNNPTAQQGCACVDGEQKINCFASACWNRVSSKSLIKPYEDDNTIKLLRIAFLDCRLPFVECL
jgi:hypothetical protein